MRRAAAWTVWGLPVMWLWQRPGPAAEVIVIFVDQNGTGIGNGSAAVVAGNVLALPPAGRER